MKNVYLIFSFTGTWFSTFLRFMSKEKYIHVSLSFNDDLKEVYSFGRYNPRWAFPCGFAIEDMNRVTKYFKNAICQVYTLPVTKNKYQQLEKEIKKYIDNRNAYHYNIKGLIPIQFNKVYHRDYHFVCSQFVGKLLGDIQIHNFDKDYSLIRPKDIVKMPKLKLIYEGKVIDYLRKIEDEKAL